MKKKTSNGFQKGHKSFLTVLSKEKIGNALRGRKVSEETRCRMIESNSRKTRFVKGSPSLMGMLGKKHSEATKLKMKESAMGRNHDYGLKIIKRNIIKCLNIIKYLYEKS